MIEKDFDSSFIGDLALREKQVQQNYRPIIAIHKWFARRPGTLFRGLLLSEFVEDKLTDSFFRSHNLHGIRVADPFMGGGTPLIEANRIGCDVVGYDINPMAYWIVRQAIGHIDLKAYCDAATQLQAWLEQQIGTFYRTECSSCSSKDAHVKYFIWVKTHRCDHCGTYFDLFPGYLLAEDRRHPKNVIICSVCGELNEVVNRKDPGQCHTCSARLKLTGPAGRNRCPCPYCGKTNSYPVASAGVPHHRMVAIEYHCPTCKSHHNGRFFKRPDSLDLAKYDQVLAAWNQMHPRYVPDDLIPPGDETDRLHRWGYRQYRDMFNERQLLGLELSCQFIDRYADTEIRDALATNLSDLLRYQNMLCRYDTMALKSLDIFSVHGFPVGLIQCESNMLGIASNLNGLLVGSGGWSNIVEKYVRAKTYCTRPFEVRYDKGRKVQVPISGEWIGEHRNSSDSPERRGVELFCGSSTLSNLPAACLDAVLTDPPYFANVQYAELMDFCYVWLRRLVTDPSGAFIKRSTRDENELTGNTTMERGLTHFTEGLTAVFTKMAHALKPGAPLAFTYHHNTLEAYYPVAVAILDSRLTCSASLSCPAEMAGSIHINGTSSSVIDTIFVCRSTGSVPRRLIVSTSEEIASLVHDDIQHLRIGNLKPTRADIRCVAYGHLIRLAIWNLRDQWKIDQSASMKLKAVAAAVEKLGGWSGVEIYLVGEFLDAPKYQNARLREECSTYSDKADEIRF